MRVGAGAPTLSGPDAITEARAQMLRAHNDAAKTLLDHARRWAQARGDAAIESLALAVGATLAMRTDDYEAAAALGEEALLLAGPFTNPSASAEACLTLCMVYSEIGLIDEALRMAEDGRTFALIANDQRLLSWSYTRIGDALLLKQALYGMPTLHLSIQQYGLARRLARATGDSDSLLASLNNLVRAVVETPTLGDDLVPPVSARAMRLAVRAGEWAMKEIGRSGNRQAARVVEPNYAGALCKVGRFDEGKQLLEHLIATRPGERDRYCLLRLGTAEIENGQLDTGCAHLQESLSHSLRAVDWPAVVHTRQLLSKVAQKRGDFVQALSYLHDLERERRQQFVAQEKIRQTIDRRVRHLREALWQAAHARADAETDPLTNVLNRRGFPAKLGIAIALARAQQVSYAIAMIDIDFFKAINDQCGHLVGDQVLKRVAQTLKENCREQDLLGRYGGDEFVLGVMAANKSALAARCEQLRQAIEQLDIEKLSLKVRLSISVGISDLSETADVTALLTLADARLYEAKRNGRNRVQT
jgi:diguanylate cyclase (GGDEF)-like protein